MIILVLNGPDRFGVTRHNSDYFKLTSSGKAGECVEEVCYFVLEMNTEI